MFWIALGELLVGIWLILSANEAPSVTLTVIFGVAVVVCALLTLFGARDPR